MRVAIIFQVVGDKNVTFKDRAKLPYIAATVNEIMRLKTIGTSICINFDKHFTFMISNSK